MNLNILSKSLFCILLFTLFACKKSKNEKPAQGHDIYIAGDVNGQPVYWKNGIKTSLPPYSSNGTIGGQATGIAFSGDDLYVCGMSGIWGGSKAIYWENGTLDTLPVIQGHPTNAVAITSLGKDIYIGGGNNGYATGQEINGATLWKNGVPTEFGGSNTRIYNLFATDKDLYSAGPDGNISNSYATYYKNGVVVKLSDHVGATSTDIYVSGSDIYVSGYEYNVIGRYAVYWKNGIQTTLSSQYSSSNAIYVSGGDVYVAGYESVNNKTVATIWKNGAATHLSSSQSYCNDIIVLDNDVYAIGEMAIENTLSGKAVLWKNNTTTFLASTESSALNIYVK